MKRYLNMFLMLLLALALMAGCGSSYFKKNNDLEAGGEAGELSDA